MQLETLPNDEESENFDRMDESDDYDEVEYDSNDFCGECERYNGNTEKFGDEWTEGNIPG